MADLLHLQVVAPSALRRTVTDYVETHSGARNVVVLVDAARQPAGDVITFDITRESINEVLDQLETMGVVEHGSITVSHTELALSRSADVAQADVPGDPDDTVIWDEVSAALHQAVLPSFPYLAYFVVAAVIAAAGVMTDSPILIVGAMVVGPEYGPVASVAFGLQRRDLGLAVRGAATFLLGSALAIGAAALVTLAVRAADQVPAAYAGDRALTSFITNPDLFTVIVASAAAVAGVLALTQDRAGTLVGVLISVTTIPAIAEIGVGVAFTDADEVTGALAQLALNLVCLIVVGILTLVVLQRRSPDGPRPHRVM